MTMLERGATRGPEDPTPASEPSMPSPVLEASASAGPANDVRAQAPDLGLCEEFLGEIPRGPILTLTQDSLQVVQEALESVPRPPGIREGQTYQVGQVEITAPFLHRASYETAAWYTDTEVGPQTAPIFRRHWNGKDSDPFVEPQGTLKEHHTPTLFGGVQVGEHNSFEHSGEPVRPLVSLRGIPMPAVVMVDQPNPARGPALTSFEQQVMGRIADQLPLNFKEYARNPAFWAIKAEQLAGPELPKLQVESSLSYMAQMGYLQRGGRDNPESYFPARWEEIAAFRAHAAPVHDFLEDINPPFRHPDRWEDHDYRRTGELAGARPVWDLRGMTIAGPSLIPEVIKPNGMKETKQAAATLHTLFHRAVMVANGKPPQGHYYGQDAQGRHRVT